MVTGDSVFRGDIYETGTGICILVTANVVIGGGIVSGASGKTKIVRGFFIFPEVIYLMITGIVVNKPVRI